LGVRFLFNPEKMSKYIIVTALGLCLSVPGYAQSEQPGAPSQADAKKDQPTTGPGKATRSGQQGQRQQGQRQQGQRQQGQRQQGQRQQGQRQQGQRQQGQRQQGQRQQGQRQQGQRQQNPAAGKAPGGRGPQSPAAGRAPGGKGPQSSAAGRPQAGKGRPGPGRGPEGPPPPIKMALEKLYGNNPEPEKGIPSSDVMKALMKLDKNKDGKLSPNELFGNPQDRP